MILILEKCIAEAQRETAIESIKSYKEKKMQQNQLEIVNRENDKLQKII